MRPIKFRAWNHKIKEMEIIEDFYWFEENGVHDCEGEGHTGKFILMQFTGLLDKNGMEIYEGDLFKHSTGQICEIKFSDGAFCFKSKKIAQYLCYGANHGEVIGNIYENPELLKGESTCPGNP